MLNDPTLMLAAEGAAPAPEAAPAAIPAPEDARLPDANDAPKEEPKAPEDNPRFSKAFAAIKQREKALMAKEQAMREREKKFQDWDADSSLLKEKPLEYLKRKAGLSYDDLTRMVLNDGAPTPELEVRSLKEEIAALKESLKADAERQKQEQVQGAAAARQAEAKKTLSSDPERFELTSAHPTGHELVLQVMDEFAETSEAQGQPRRLSFEEAADAVEKYLEAEVSKLFEFKKLQGRLKPKDAPAEAQPAPAQPKPAPQVTLTNGQAANAPTPTTNRAKTLEESLEEAARLIRFV